MSDSECDGVGGIVGFRYFLEVKYRAGHFLHLLFFGSAVARYGAFDLQGGIFEYRQSRLSCGEQSHPASLSDVDTRLLIGIEEQLFYADHIGLVALQQHAHIVIDGEQPTLELVHRDQELLDSYHPALSYDEQGNACGTLFEMTIPLNYHFSDDDKNKHEE